MGPSPDPTFDVYVLKEDKTPPRRFGAFHHDGTVIEVPYGAGQEPDRAIFGPADLVLTGESEGGVKFEIRLPGELLSIDTIDRGWGHRTFWVTDGQRLLGIRVGKHEAAKVEALLRAYGGSVPQAE
jgi:hypothetical protein